LDNRALETVLATPNAHRFQQVRDIQPFFSWFLVKQLLLKVTYGRYLCVHFSMLLRLLPWSTLLYAVRAGRVCLC
jgi:hypothetical protein